MSVLLASVVCVGGTLFALGRVALQRQVPQASLIAVCWVLLGMNALLVGAVVFVGVSTVVPVIYGIGLPWAVSLGLRGAQPRYRCDPGRVRSLEHELDVSPYPLGPIFAPYPASVAISMQGRGPIQSTSVSADRTYRPMKETAAQFRTDDGPTLRDAVNELAASVERARTMGWDGAGRHTNQPEGPPLNGTDT
jgi:hypothetical protein